LQRWELYKSANESMDNGPVRAYYLYTRARAQSHSIVQGCVDQICRWSLTGLAAWIRRRRYQWEGPQWEGTASSQDGAGSTSSVPGDAQNSDSDRQGAPGSNSSA
jgi:hypothetical protein